MIHLSEPRHGISDPPTWASPRLSRMITPDDGIPLLSADNWRDAVSELERLVLASCPTRVESDVNDKIRRLIVSAEPANIEVGYAGEGHIAGHWYSQLDCPGGGPIMLTCSRSYRAVWPDGVRGWVYRVSIDNA